MSTFIVVNEEGGEGSYCLLVPASGVVQNILNEFLMEHAAEINALLAPYGESLGTIAQPEWKRMATLDDLSVSGNGNEIRSQLAEKMLQLRKREEYARESEARQRKLKAEIAALMDVPPEVVGATEAEGDGL